MKTLIPIINRSPHPMPSYATPDAAGMDLRAFLETPITLAPLARKCIPTGISIALPKGYEAQVRGRSGLALKHGITILNAPGTIDADYRGDIGAMLINLSDTPFTIQNGERIAQLIITTYTHATWQPVDQLPPSQRGEGGFGSTGIH